MDTDFFKNFFLLVLQGVSVSRRVRLAFSYLFFYRVVGRMFLKLLQPQTFDVSTDVE